MKISLESIKKLRGKTGAGVMEAKKALEESGGDEQKAIVWLRERGLEKVEKRAGRVASEGWIASYVHHDGKLACLVELSCETDFVARTEEFRKLATELAMQVASMNPKNTEELLNEEYIRDPGKSVAQLVGELVGKTGEKIEVRRFVRMELGEDD